MFTAFDISLEAQQRGCQERHGQLKRIIHQAYFSGEMGPEYQRILVDIPGADQPAWLYYHESDDPTFYQPLARSRQLPSRPTLRLVTGAATTSSSRKRSQPTRRTVFSLLSFFGRCPHCSQG
jgi:hypothetical protein